MEKLLDCKKSFLSCTKESPCPSSRKWGFLEPRMRNGRTYKITIIMTKLGNLDQPSSFLLAKESIKNIRPQPLLFVQHKVSFFKLCLNLAFWAMHAENNDLLDNILSSSSQKTIFSFFNFQSQKIKSHRIANKKTDFEKKVFFWKLHQIWKQEQFEKKQDCFRN